jgi:two-component sensor histidine kinase
MELKLLGLKPRKLILNAHVLALTPGSAVQIVLAVSDVTAAREAERIKDDLVRDKHLLLVELQHRVANSLQIIASVLMQSVRQVQSEETRGHLRDAHRRVMSIATLQRQLASTQADEVALAPYLTDLCNSIGASMIGDPELVQLVVTADGSKTTGDASASLGLIVTELVINALKHAFPVDGPGGQIDVDYHATPTGWSLSVSDDGVGLPRDHIATKPGLGTGIVNALAGHLGAVVNVTDASPGTRVSVVNG